MVDHVELAVIGAGVVGCAVASQLARRGIEVFLLEGAEREGTGVSARNSGVLHAGLYYPPTSRKARHCIRGRERLVAWARAHDVPHRITGKLVVARPGEEAVIEALAANARDSGANAELVDDTFVHAREPSLPRSGGALWSPDSGIVDPHSLTRSLLVDAQRHGAVFVPQSKVRQAEAQPGYVHLETSRGPLRCARVVNCAGLGANAIAAFFGIERELFPCRGDYFRLRSRVEYRHLVYPARTLAGGLGVHLTLELDGGVRLGPDARWVDDPADFGEPEVDLHGAFLAAARELLGEIAAEDLSYDGCGIRPKLFGPADEPADFEFHRDAHGGVHLLGIESPGLTAALSLADETADLICGRTGP